MGISRINKSFDLPKSHFHFLQNVHEKQELLNSRCCENQKGKYKNNPQQKEKEHELTFAIVDWYIFF